MAWMRTLPRMSLLPTTSTINGLFSATLPYKGACHSSPLGRLSLFSSTCAKCTPFSHKMQSRTLTATSTTAAASDAPPAAAFMVIGDEILNGSISDSNTPWLAKLLHSRGVDLVRVEMVPDDAADIAATVLRLRERVGPTGYVFTSGGIGPTHDDITYDSIAAALGLTVELHQPTVERMQTHYDARGLELNESRLHMAKLPTPCEVLVTDSMWVPLAVVGGNVHILPGIPRLFQSMVEAHKHRFKGAVSASTVSLFSSSGEGDLAHALGEVAAAFPNVRIGSYPNTQFDLNNPEKEQLQYRVKLVFEGRDAAAVAAAAAAAQAAIPGTIAAPAENATR